ncbi:MAG TPA: PAS domain S-box protein [Actinomycetota bacterium]|nr:PAS domain S-box protein [Actinomycetota bacterium]
MANETEGAATNNSAVATPGVEAVPASIVHLLGPTGTASSPATSAQAFQDALDLVCRYTAWPLGHLFRFDAQRTVLVSGNIWHVEEPERHEAFIDATRRRSLAPGVGLPGRIFASGQPVWIEDVRTDSNFSRSSVALECGIGAGFGFPIISSQGIEAVMEFFAPEAVQPDTALLDLVSYIGVQVGKMLDLARAQSSLEVSEHRLRTLFEQAPDALIVVDTAGAILLMNQETEHLTGYRREDLIGETIEILVPGSALGDHAAFRKRYMDAPHRRAMGAGKDLLLRRFDGSMVPVEISLSPTEAPHVPPSWRRCATSRSASGRKRRCAPARQT